MKLDKNYKLKEHVYFGEVEGGVIFDAGSDSFVFKVNNMYPLVERVVQFMDNGFVLSDIINKVPEALKTVVERLIENLSSHGMIFDVSAQNEVRDGFTKSTVSKNFLNYYLNNIEIESSTKIGKWLDTSVTVVGSGAALVQAVKSLDQSGVGNIEIILQNDTGSLLKKKIESTLSLNKSDEGLIRSYRFVEPGKLESVVERSEYTMFALSNDEEVSLYQDLFKRLNKIGKKHIVCGRLHGHCVISPLSTENSTSSLDLIARISAKPQQELATPSVSAIGLSGSLAALTLINHVLTINNDKSRNRAVFINEDLETESQWVVPSNLLSGKVIDSNLIRSQVELPDGRVLDDYEQVLIDIAPLFDKHTGIFDKQSSSSINQVPVFIDVLDIHQGVQSSKVWGFGLNPVNSSKNCNKKAIRDALLVSNSELNSFTSVAFSEKEWREEAALRAALFDVRFDKFSTHTTVYGSALESNKHWKLVKEMLGATTSKVRFHIYGSSYVDGVSGYVTIENQVLPCSYASSNEDLLAELCASLIGCEQLREQGEAHAHVLCKGDLEDTTYLQLAEFNCTEVKTENAWLALGNNHDHKEALNIIYDELSGFVINTNCYLGRARIEVNA